MPTYNRRQFIGKAVELFHRQDYPNRELVVVDDGPDPLTGFEATGEAIRYVTLDERATIGAKRNLACELARGDILVQWDDDDWYGPERIRQQAMPLVRGRADLTYLLHDWLFDLRTGRFWRQGDVEPLIASGTFAFTRAIWQTSGGYPDSSVGEDWAFFSRVGEVGGHRLRVEHAGNYVYVRHLSNAWGMGTPSDSRRPRWIPADQPPFLTSTDLGFYRELMRIIQKSDLLRQEASASSIAGMRRGQKTTVRQAKGDDPSELQRPVPFAIVQHANQYLIGDDYRDREGIAEILQGYCAVLRLHLKYRIPLNLHISGTLIESIAWHRPEFFGWLLALQVEGLLEILGSTYSQNIMPLSSDEQNLRQLTEALQLYSIHLGVDAGDVRGFWVPERVWDTQKLARLLRDSRLPNGGYGFVLLDDRLGYCVNSSTGLNPRERFDHRFFNFLESRAMDGDFEGPCPFAPYQIVGGEGLQAIPVSGPLRHCIPPRERRDWVQIRDVFRSIRVNSSSGIAVYGDDLEKAAAVGPWAHGARDGAGAKRYERLLAWLQHEERIKPTLLSAHLIERPPSEVRDVEPGTYVELARVMGAGEDYLRWWGNPEWTRYRRLLEEAEALLRRDGPLAQTGLWGLAWKHLMACNYEAGWHVPDGDGRYRPAAWSKATAAHVGSLFVIVGAASWQRSPTDQPKCELIDIDRDGEDEVVLANNDIYAVFTPEHGGRLVYLFDLTHSDGTLVVGNPTDDWHLQEELNRFMHRPRNHPGGFADVGHEDASYAVDALSLEGQCMEMRLVNKTSSGPFARATKTFRLGVRARYLEASYRLPAAPAHLSMEFALSPDYLSLLRGGRDVLRPVSGRSTRGWANGQAAVWVHLPAGEPLFWEDLGSAACGHGMVLRVAAYRPTFRLHLGVGAPPRGDRLQSEGVHFRRASHTSRERGVER